MTITVELTADSADDVEYLLKTRLAMLMTFNDPDDGLGHWEDEYGRLARLLRDVLAAKGRERRVAVLDMPTDESSLCIELGMTDATAPHIAYRG